MTPEQIAIVQRSWRSMLPIRDTFAELLYGKLFSLEPRLRPLFRGEMKDQGRNLAAMMSIGVNHLARLDSVSLALGELGQRHARYGVRREDYDTFGTALLWTLSQALGDELTAEAADAWREAYGVLAAAMKEAAPSRALA